MSANGMIRKYVVVCVLLLTGLSLSACSDDGESPTDTAEGDWYLRYSHRPSNWVAWAEVRVAQFERSLNFYLETDTNWVKSWGNAPPTPVGYWKFSGSRLNDTTWLIPSYESNGMIRTLSTREDGTRVIFYSKSLGHYYLPPTEFRDAGNNSLGTFDITVYQK